MTLRDPFEIFVFICMMMSYSYTLVQGSKNESIVMTICTIAMAILILLYFSLEK